MITLPFEPENEESLKLRFPEALKNNYTAKEGMQVTPGMFRKHVFDWLDGLRMIISFDIFEEDEAVIHVSVSGSEDSKLVESLEKIECEDNKIAEITKITQQRINSLCGFNCPICLVGVSGGVIHWIGPSLRGYRRRKYVSDSINQGDVSPN